MCIFSIAGHIVNVYKFSGVTLTFGFNYFTSNHLTQREDCQRKWAHIISGSIALPSPEHTILALEKICQSFLVIYVLFYRSTPSWGNISMFFSAVKAAQEAQMSVRSSVHSSVRQDTLTLTAYKSLSRCCTSKCEVSLESFTQWLLN